MRRSPRCSSRTAGSRAPYSPTGDELRAPIVVTSLHPKRAFLDHVGAANLPDDFVRDIERWRSRSGVVKINLAIDRAADFTADPTDGQAELHTGSVEMAPTMEYIERAFHRRPRGPAGRGAVLRRRHPDHPGQDAQPRRHAHLLAVHPVGAGGLERRSRTPPSSRPTPTG